MTIDTNDILNSILESLSRIDYIHPEDIPNIDLYMDQVTTFMDTQLSSTKRYADDKILTKTMINNYAKNNLLPPPVKKKYSREHVLVLIFIYYFKSMLSIKDIDTLLHPVLEKYFQTDSELDLTSIYKEVFSLSDTQLAKLREDLSSSSAAALQTFTDVKDPKERDFLQLFSFLCTLSFDVYMKKQLIEQIIDLFPEPEHRK